MIGGQDLIIEGATSADDWTVLLYEIRQRWPNAIFHKIGNDEWFVYRDQSAFRHEYAPDEVPNGFVHVLISSDSLTLVVDDDETTDAHQVGTAVFGAMRALRGYASE